MGLVEDVWAQLGWLGLAALAAGACVLWQMASWLSERRRLRATGGTAAPRFAGRWPWGVDLVLSTMRAARSNRNRELWEDIFARVGGSTAEFRVLDKRIVFTVDPDNIKAILATQFGDYGKGDPFHEQWRPFLGDSIFTTDGGRWHASRQLLRPQFVKDRVADLHTFDAHLHTLFAAMAVGGDAAATAAAVRQAGAADAPPLSAHGRVVDISDLFFRYTLDVATDFLLGKDVQSLTIPANTFAEAFTEVQHIQGLIARTGPANGFIPRGAYRRGIQVIDAFVNPFVDRALQLPPAELEAKVDRADGSYTFLHELARFTRDRQVLRDQVVAVLLAGRDTTAATLSWAVYELSKHPEVVRRLRAEIADHVGLADDQNDSSTTARAPTYADLKNMKYLQHILSETLRLYPAVPFNVRLALCDTTLPTGGGPDGRQPVAVLKDTPIGYSTLCMQRRADLYPAHLPGPNVFAPERWDHWQPRPWHYIPFNGGPRICIGQQFALTEMAYVLVRLFQKFDRVVSHMDPIDGGKPTLKADIVLQPADGVHVAFYEANKE